VEEKNLDRVGQEQLSSSHGTGEGIWDQDEQKGAASVAEERSGAKENQAGGGEHGGEEGLVYVYCIHLLGTC